MAVAGVFFLVVGVVTTFRGFRSSNDAITFVGVFTALLGTAGLAEAFEYAMLARWFIGVDALFLISGAMAWVLERGAKEVKK